MDDSLMIPHYHRPSLTPGHHPRTSMSVHSRSRSSLVSDNGRWSSRFGYENAPPLPEFSRTGAPLRSEGCYMGDSLDGHMLKAPVVHKRHKGNKPHASKSLPDLRRDLNHRASKRSIPKYCLTKPLPPLPSEVYNGDPISDLRPPHGGGDFFVPPSIEKPVEVKRKFSKVFQKNLFTTPAKRYTLPSSPTPTFCPPLDPNLYPVSNQSYHSPANSTSSSGSSNLYTYDERGFWMGTVVPNEPGMRSPVFPVKAAFYPHGASGKMDSDCLTSFMDMDAPPESGMMKQGLIKIRKLFGRASGKVKNVFSPD